MNFYRIEQIGPTDAKFVSGLPNGVTAESLRAVGTRRHSDHLKAVVKIGERFELRRMSVICSVLGKNSVRTYGFDAGNPEDTSDVLMYSRGWPKDMALSRLLTKMTANYANVRSRTAFVAVGVSDVLVPVIETNPTLERFFIESARLTT